MEHFALQALLWLGKIILGQAGSVAVKAVWSRLFPHLKNLIESAAFWRTKAAEHQDEIARFEETGKSVAEILEEADRRIMALERDNAQLRQRLSKYEPVDPSTTE